MHISDLKAYSDNTPAFIADRQVEQTYSRKSRCPQARSKSELAELPADIHSPDMYKGIFIDVYV